MQLHTGEVEPLIHGSGRDEQRDNGAVYRKQESKIWTKALTFSMATGLQIHHGLYVQSPSSYQLSTSCGVCILPFPFYLRGVESSSASLYHIAWSRVSRFSGGKGYPVKLEF